MELEKLKKIIAEQFGIDEESITEDTPFKELGDSMDLIELIMALEEEFDMEIDDDETNKIKTVGDAAEYIIQNS